MRNQRSLDLVIVTTEVVPFSKVGGLADVMGALPDELDALGARVKIMTPLYSSIDRSRFGIELERALPPLEVRVAGRTERFRVHSALKPGTKVKVYFLESDRFYTRPGIYTVPETGKAFPDEDERTIFFNRAAIRAMKALALRPEVVHCNDFHAGLIPAYLELEESDDPHVGGATTVFSVHNLAYQGIFPREFLQKAGLKEALFVPMSPFEYWGKVNVMKIAISFAGIISTVSRRYAEEITTTEEYGYGLEGVLRGRKKDLVGILNGIDQKVWDPANDTFIPERFTAGNLAGKSKDRTALLKAFGLPAKSAGPVVGMVSRLVDQKGFDILAEAFDSLAALGIKLVILGTGQEKYQEAYKRLAAKYPKKLGLKLEFNDPMAHLIEAGSDFFLMPSRYEPSGLNQMYSLRYGTIPIVRATGGLYDTIAELDRIGANGNGFTFKEYTAAALTEAVKRAVVFYADKTALRNARKRIMAADHSWRRSAKEYLAMYERARSLMGMELTK